MNFATFTHLGTIAQMMIGRKITGFDFGDSPDCDDMVHFQLDDGQTVSFTAISAAGFGELQVEVVEKREVTIRMKGDAS